MNTRNILCGFANALRWYTYINQRDNSGALPYVFIFYPDKKLAQAFGYVR